MNNNGYYGDFNSFAEEQAEYNRWLSNQEPEVIPCKCGKPMYETEEKCEGCKLENQSNQGEER